MDQDKVRPEANESSAPIYVSTGCLRTPEPLENRLEKYSRYGLNRVELGAGVKVTPASLSDLSGSPLDLLVHNYFPPPDDPFVLNLASPDRNIRRRSLELATRALDLCVKIGAPMYTVHAGFVTDPYAFNGSSFVFPEPEGKSARVNAMERFIDALKVVASNAEKRGVRLLVENNVCSSRLVGKLLLQDAREFDRLFESIQNTSVGLLLDTGHLNVSARTLGFDRVEFVAKHKNNIGALHLHDNDGTADQHRPAQEGSWVFDAVERLDPLDDIPVVVESTFSDVAELSDYVNWLERLFNENGDD